MENKKEYLDLSPLDNTRLKKLINSSMYLTRAEMFSINTAKDIEKKALIIGYLDKAYRVRIWYLGYNQQTREPNRYSIVCYFPKFFNQFDGKGNKNKIFFKVIKGDDIK